MSVPPEHRFATLDGLRGMAALMVVLYHAGPLSPLAMPSGYLAVDLFFVLSGFVMAEIYGPRLAQGMTAIRFLAARLMRLYPLYLVGAVLGLAVGGGIAAYRHEPFGWTVPFTLAMLPTPGPATAYLFPANIPAWSLFDELLVNAVFGLVAWRWSTRALALTAALLAIGLLVSFDGTGAAGDTVSSAHIGLLRAAYGFVMGLIIRRGWNLRRLSCTTDLALLVPIALAALLAGSFGPGSTLAIVLVVLPALVCLGVCLEPRARGLSLAGGSISYALYCTHGPLLNVARIIAIRSPAPVATMAVAIAAMVAFAAALDKSFDPAARRWLNRAFGGARARC